MTSRVRFQVISENNKSTLIINEVFPEDEGEFTCTAVNTFGMAQSKTTLTVESKYLEMMKPYLDIGEVDAIGAESGTDFVIIHHVHSNLRNRVIGR